MGTDLRRRRGRAPLWARRCDRRVRCVVPVSRSGGVVALEPFQRAGFRLGPRDFPVRRLPRHRPDRRLARHTPEGRSGDCGGESRRGGSAPRPARPTRRPARGDGPVWASPRLLARGRPGIRRLHQRAPRAGRFRPRHHRPRRGRPRRGDSRGRTWDGHGLPAGLSPARAGVRARGGARGEARLPARDGAGPLSGRERSPRAGPAEPSACALAGGAPDDRDARPRPRGAGLLLPGGDRARRFARPAGRDRGPEHPRLRSGADDRGRVPAPVRAASRLRFARVARAAQPDGGRDRRGPHVAGTLA